MTSQSDHEAELLPTGWGKQSQTRDGARGSTSSEISQTFEINDPPKEAVPSFGKAIANLFPSFGSEGHEMNAERTYAGFRDDLDERDEPVGRREAAIMAMAVFYRSWHVQAFLFILVVGDVVVFVLDWIIDLEWADKTLDRTVGIIFGLETIGCMWVFGLEDFFEDFDNILDFSVLVGTVAELMATFILHVSNPDGFRQVAKIVKYTGKVVRFARILRIIRRRISQNKQRHVDKAIDVNIDLSYITPDLIAMSAPAMGVVAVYRNPISEVARFFQTRHKGKYRIYNVCPELPYPSSYFADAVVRRLDVQDHSPPNMNKIFDFLDDAAAYKYPSPCLEESLEAEGVSDRVIAVHCKGGKGRTGTLCCAWLLFTRRCATLDEALKFFAKGRTDENIEGKLQGVETKGQVRYLQFVEKFLAENQIYHPIATPPLLRPPCLKFIRIAQFVFKQATVQDMLKLNSDLSIRVFNPSWRSGPGPQVAHVDVPFDSIVEQLSEDGTLKITFEPELSVKGDFRIDVVACRFQKQKEEGSGGGADMRKRRLSGAAHTQLSKRELAGKEPGLWIYMILHAAFLSTGPDDYIIDACDLDKTKLQKKVRAARLNPAGGIALVLQG